MKFSLKQLILVVTVSALLCGLASYAFTRIKMAEQHSIQLRMEAEQEREIALSFVMQAQENQLRMEAKLAKATELLANALQVDVGEAEKRLDAALDESDDRK